jgi:hypothetical protein
MIWATVEFPEDRALKIDLVDAGWRMRGADARALGRILDRDANPSDYGPSGGDPVARAADAAAELLGGVVTYVRQPDPVPEDAVF